MSYTAQQIYDAASALSQQGLSNEQIFAEASKYGITPTALSEAYEVARPDLFGNTADYSAVADFALGQIGQGNFSTAMDSLNTLNANPQYQALLQLEDYASQYEPAPAPSIHTANNLPAEYRAPAAAPVAPTGAAPAPYAPPQPRPPTAPIPQMPSPGNTQVGGAPGYGGNQSNPYLSGSPGGQFSSMYGGYQASPWLSATADEIGRRTQQGLGQAFNQIRSNHVGNGTLGGSRQGVAEGIATRGAMDSLQGNLAGLYGTDWTGAQNRGLSQYGLDQNFYTAQRGQDLTQLGLGAQITDMGYRGGWMPLNNASGIFNTVAGNNVTSTSGGTQGGNWQGLLGGALGGAQFGQNMNWWG